MTKARAVDVAAYILAQGPREALELQKLVYYVQAWSLAWEGEPLFDGRIEAWPMGPVVPDLWRQHRNRPVVHHVAGDRSALTPQDESIVDAILEFYGGLGSSRLVGMTHEDKPWQDARGELAADARSSRRISESAMRRYYSAQQVMGAEAPRRSAVPTVEAPLAHSLDVVDRLIKDWRETLDWLAVR